MCYKGAPALHTMHGRTRVRHVRLCRLLGCAAASGHTFCRAALKDLPHFSLLIVLLLLVNSMFRQGKTIGEESAEILHLKGALATANGEISTLTSELSSFKTSVDAKEVEISRLKEAAQKNDVTIRSKSNEIEQLNGKISTLTADVQTKASELASAKAELKTKSDEIDQLNRVIANTKKDESAQQ